MKQKASANDNTHPYMKGFLFWGKPENQFWERDGYTQAGKNYHRENVKAMQKDERCLTKVDSSITNNKKAL